MRKETCCAVTRRFKRCHNVKCSLTALTHHHISTCHDVVHGGPRANHETVRPGRGNPSLVGELDLSALQVTALRQLRQPRQLRQDPRYEIHLSRYDPYDPEISFATGIEGVCRKWRHETESHAMNWDFFWPILAVSRPFPSFFHPFPLLGAAFCRMPKDQAMLSAWRCEFEFPLYIFFHSFLHFLRSFSKDSVVLHLFPNYYITALQHEGRRGRRGWFVMPLCRPWPPSAAPSHWWRRAETSHRKLWKTKPLPNSAFLTCLWRYWKMSKDWRDSHFEKPVFNQFEPIVSSWGFSNGFQPWSMLIDVDRCWSMLINVDRCWSMFVAPGSFLQGLWVLRPWGGRDSTGTEEKTTNKSRKKTENTMENVWFWQFWAGSFLDCLNSLILKHADVFTYLYIDVSTVILCDSLWHVVTVSPRRARSLEATPTLDPAWERRCGSSDHLMSDELDEL